MRTRKFRLATLYLLPRPVAEVFVGDAPAVAVAMQDARAAAFAAHGIAVHFSRPRERIDHCRHAIGLNNPFRLNRFVCVVGDHLPVRGHRRFEGLLAPDGTAIAVIKHDIIREQRQGRLHIAFEHGVDKGCDTGLRRCCRRVRSAASEHQYGRKNDQRNGNRKKRDVHGGDRTRRAALKSRWGIGDLIVCR